MDDDADHLAWVMADPDAMLACYADVAGLDLILRRPGSDRDPQGAADWSTLHRLHHAWRQQHRTPSDQVALITGLALTVARMRWRVGIDTWLPGWMSGNAGGRVH